MLYNDFSERVAGSCEDYNQGSSCGDSFTYIRKFYNLRTTNQQTYKRQKIIVGAVLMQETNNSNTLDYICGISDDELLYRFKEAVRIENEIRKIKGLPIAKYDFGKNAPYVEYPDGRRLYG